MPVTPTWSIFYRNTSTAASLEAESATQATSVEVALSALQAAIPTLPVGAFVSLGMTAAQNAAGGGSPAPVLWDTEISDVDGFHSTSSNTDRITVPAGLDGRYLINASVTLNASTAGKYIIGWFTKNGVAIPGTTQTTPTVAGVNNPTWQCSVIIALVAGDIIRLAIAGQSTDPIVPSASGIQLEKLS